MFGVKNIYIYAGLGVVGAFLLYKLASKKKEEGIDLPAGYPTANAPAEFPHAKYENLASIYEMLCNANNNGQPSNVSCIYEKKGDFLKCEYISPSKTNGSVEVLVE